MPATALTRRRLVLLLIRSTSELAATNALAPYAARGSTDPGRDASHLAGVEVVDCLDDLGLVVHHERSVGEHGLANRLTAEEQHFERLAGVGIGVDDQNVA